MNPLRLAAAILMILPAACASTKPPQFVAPTHQYRVRILPVEGAAAALEEAPGEDGVPVNLTADQFSDRLLEGLRASHVFSELVTDSEGEADLILRVSVKSARIQDLGANGGAFLSTVSWFLIPFLWFADDRSYALDFSVQAELFTASDLDRPLASFVAAAGEQTLDLWDRGPNALVIIVPPALIEGSEEILSEELTERGLVALTGALVEELRRREIPFRFEIDVACAGEEVRVAVASRRLLRSLEIRAGGHTIGFWAEDGLVPVESADVLVYERTVASLPAEATVVRVIAEDEAGGREVRTVLREEE